VPDKAGQFYCPVDETKTWRTNHVWSTSIVEDTSRLKSLWSLCALWQKIICVNLC
jgi:hypothetical protein